MNDDIEREYKALALEDRMQLALSAALPAVYRPLMLREQWMHIKCYFARRQDLDADEIETLLGDQDHIIRLCIAKRGDLTPQQIARCVADRDPNVRYFIARHPRLTDAQRAQLLQDEDMLVRRSAAKGPREPKIRQRPGQAPLVG